MLQFSSLLHVIAFVYDFWYVFYVYKIAVLTDALYCVHPSATYNCCDSSLCPDDSFIHLYFCPNSVRSVLVKTCRKLGFQPGFRQVLSKTDLMEFGFY